MQISHETHKQIPNNSHLIDAPIVNGRLYQTKLASIQLFKKLNQLRKSVTDFILTYGQIGFDNYFKFWSIVSIAFIYALTWIALKTYKYIIKPSAKFSKALVIAFIKLIRALTVGIIDGFIDLFLTKKHTVSENLAKITANVGAIILIGLFVTHIVANASSGIADFAASTTLTKSQQNHISKSIDIKKPVRIGNNSQTTTPNATRLPNGDYMPAGIQYQDATTLANTYNPNQSIKVVNKLFTGTNLTEQQEFFNKITPGAQIAAKSWGVNPSVVMAQAAIESDFGRSTLASQYQNYFGIKYRGYGKKINMPTTEYYDGVTPTKINDNFQVYDSIADSMSGNGQLLRQGISGQADRYSGTWLENTSSYKDATEKGLQGKYATSPDYANTLNKMIELYGLYVLDDHPVHNSDLQK